MIHELFTVDNNYHNIFWDMFTLLNNYNNIETRDKFIITDHSSIRGLQI